MKPVLDIIFGEVPTSLKKVIITNATSIGALAFEGCTELNEHSNPR